MTRGDGPNWLTCI